jgi:hypothetical protein
VLFESLQHQIRLLADGISSLQEESRATRQTVESLVAKVEDNSVGLRTLTRELRRKGVI